MPPTRGAFLVAALALLTIAGCGNEDQVGGAVGAAGREPGVGTLVYALAGSPDELDPLLATTRPDKLLTRQVHEPLVTRLRGPFGEARGERGLATAWRASPDRVIWRFELRRRVHFQDGTPFNASAVLANAERWRSLAPGRALLPELIAVDTPRPDLVRFILSRPVDDLPGRLASPRLGIVSPRALRPHSGRAASLERMGRSGTGPFELRERERERMVIARNVEWWGTRLGLGPALDLVEFRIVPRTRKRLVLLRRGTVQVADSLPPFAVGEIRRDPLLTYVDGAGRSVLGLERSVRGIRSASAIESLSEAWLTTVGVD